MDSIELFDQVWNDFDECTIARFWAQSEFLPDKIETQFNGTYTNPLGYQ